MAKVPDQRSVLTQTCERLTAERADLATQIAAKDLELDQALADLFTLGPVEV